MKYTILKDILHRGKKRIFFKETTSQLPNLRSLSQILKFTMLLHDWKHWIMEIFNGKLKFWKWKFSVPAELLMFLARQICKQESVYIFISFQLQFIFLPWNWLPQKFLFLGFFVKQFALWLQFSDEFKKSLEFIQLFLL